MFWTPRYLDVVALKTTENRPLTAAAGNTGDDGMLFKDAGAVTGWWSEYSVKYCFGRNPI